jgi:hypothetical protein
MIVLQVSWWKEETVGQFETGDWWFYGAELTQDRLAERKVVCGGRHAGARQVRVKKAREGRGKRRSSFLVILGVPVSKYS